MTTNTIEQRVLEREREFWETMRTMDGDKAAGMTSDKCVIAGAQGVSAIDPRTMGEMMRGGTWKLHGYEIDEGSMQVTAASHDVAVIAYKVIEDLTIDNQRLTLTAFDTSVWVRDGDRWRCALHTESPAGDPFGRDRKQ